jgi:Xaa-Pro aminopeptidase
MYPHQLERLSEILDRHGLEALIATREPNVAYITGFRGLNHTVFETPQYAVFSRRGTGLVVTNVEIASIVADRTDVDHVACFGGFLSGYDERPDSDVTRIRDLMDSRAPSPADALASVLDALGVRQGTVGLDESRVTPGAWQRIAARLAGHTVVPAANHFLSARRVKGPWEIECLARGVRIAEEALNEVVAKIVVGMTEREAVTLYQSEVVKRGGDPVPAMIATGARTWIPLPLPTDRPLRAREVVRFDVGCVYGGYQATVARTAVAGEPNARLESVCGAVQAGLDAALAAVKPGVPASRVHAAAVEAAHGAGLESFTASPIGHAIGLESYERPKLTRGVETPLETGEVLRVELRHFEMGWAGVHVKETVLVTRDGARSLNRSDRGLVVLN